jgi:hypothetical protein
VRNKSLKPLAVVLAAVVLLAGGAVLAWWLGHRSTDQDTVSELRTTAVQRTSLTAGFNLSGTLGYGQATALAGATGAVVTKLPQAGEMISAGQVVMEVEGAPVFLLQGDLPLWRDLKPGVTGLDVQNLRQALERIGIGAGQGQTYDATLSAAIASLYSGAGYAEPVAMAEDKAVQEAAQRALDQANDALAEAQAQLTAAANVKPPQSSLISAQAALEQARLEHEAAQRGNCSVGGAPVACTAEVVAAAASAYALAQAQYNELTAPPDTTAQQRAVEQARKTVAEAQKAYNESLQNTVGPKNILIVPEPQIRVDQVSATLGAPVQGTILTWTKTILYGQAELTSAQQRMLTTGMAATLRWSDGSELSGTVAAINEARMDPQTYAQTPASVRVDVADQAALAQRGPSAVTISFVQEEADNTLVVPVNALVVPAEGGYCVELPDGRFVRVELGLIADTRVQIFSDELSEGDLVVVP